MQLIIYIKILVTKQNQFKVFNLHSYCIGNLSISKGGDTVLGRNNLKHLEWNVNNDGKKIKIILIFLRQASNRLTNRLTRKRNVSFIILQLDNSMTLPFGLVEQTTKKRLHSIPNISSQNRFVHNFVDFSRAKLET